MHSLNTNREKYRHELKYLISTTQMIILENRIKHIMQIDKHALPYGQYSIRSLYFDDYDNQSFRENVNGTEPREKYRIRTYNNSMEYIMLEKKRKEHGKIRKVCCQLSLNRAKVLIQSCDLQNIEKEVPLLRKFILNMHMYLLKPVVIVEYERKPYVYQNGKVRVTFDTNIAASSDINNFFGKEIVKRPLMPAGACLMEVKYDEYLPDFIYRSLNLGQLQQITYSKFALARKFKSK